jgi:hypothetical protein
MPSCDKCGAFTDETGKWAPAKHLSDTSTERDKAVKEAVEVRWTIGAMRGEVTKAQLEVETGVEIDDEEQRIIDALDAHLRTNGRVGT